MKAELYIVIQVSLEIPNYSGALVPIGRSLFADGSWGP